MQKYKITISLFILLLITSGCSITIGKNKEKESQSSKTGIAASFGNPSQDNQASNNQENESNENNDQTMQENNPQENQIITLQTSMGNIKIELFLDKAPITAGNFLKLAKEDFYDGVAFHRVIPNFMIQGGDPLSKDDNPDNDGTGGPGYFIKDEFFEGSTNLRGTIAMANAGAGTGGSQFFINTANNTFLDFDKEPLSSKHPVFGKVIEGMDIVDAIGAVETSGPPNNRPIEKIIIENIVVE